LLWLAKPLQLYHWEGFYYYSSRFCLFRSPHLRWGFNDDHNYVIHTDAIKENIVPALTERQKKFVYADEADVLNVALFGQTAKEWRSRNPDKAGNMRDYTDVLHLVVLINLENLNAEMIHNKIAQPERLVRLNEIACRQLNLLEESNQIKKLGAGD
jgi:hypothetical protein